LLQLDDIQAVVQGFRVDDHLHVQGAFVHDLRHGVDVDPQVVGVEDLELLHALKVLQMVLGDLCDLKQSQVPAIVDEGTALNVGPCLVGDLHEEVALFVAADEEVEDLEVDRGAQVVDVGDEHVLLAFLLELLEEARVLKRLVEISVTRGVPALLLVRLQRLRNRHEGLLVDAGVAGLVEGADLDVEPFVFADDFRGVFVGVEGVHQDQGNVGVISRVQVLDLLHSQVQEGEVPPDCNDGLRALAPHGRAKTSVELDHHEFVEQLLG